MLKNFIITAASAAIIATMSIASTASAAPASLAGLTAAKAETGLVQVRRGGGFHGGGGRIVARHFRRHGYGHRHWRRYHRVYVGGYGGGYGDGCGFYWRRWQATGIFHWKAKYNACMGY